MDTSFNCPKCNLHITADECVVGEEIDCPECGEKFRVPPPKKARPVPVIVKSAAPLAAPVQQTAPAHPVPVPAVHPATAAAPARPEAKPAAHAPEHKPLVVPHHHGPQESLVKKAAHTEHKDEPPKVRVKTIKRGSCVEVGHDLFDEKVTEFLNKIGRENIIHMSAIAYGAMDSTGHMLPDYGIMIVYNG
jgi:DNA-directed RNA polymerase subunit RPC12/RpoP